MEEKQQEMLGKTKGRQREKRKQFSQVEEELDG